MSKVFFDIGKNIPEERQKLLKKFLFASFFFLGGMLLMHGHSIFVQDHVSFEGVYNEADNTMIGTWDVDRLPDTPSENQLYAIKFTSSYIQFSAKPINLAFVSENVKWWYS